MSQSKQSKHASTPQFQLMIHPFFFQCTPAGRTILLQLGSHFAHDQLRVVSCVESMELMELGAHVSVPTKSTCKLRFPLSFGLPNDFFSMSFLLLIE